LQVQQVDSGDLRERIQKNNTKDLKSIPANSDLTGIAFLFEKILIFAKHGEKKTEEADYFFY